MNNASVVSSTYALIGSTETLGGPINQPAPAASAFLAVGASSLFPSWSANGNPSFPPLVTTYTVTLSTVGTSAGCGAVTCSVAAAVGAAGALSVSSAAMGAVLYASLTGLSANTTYYLYVSTAYVAGFPLGTIGAPVAADVIGSIAAGSTSTLANPPLVAAAPVTSSFTNVAAGQISALWSQNGNPGVPPGLTTYTVVLATANFIGSSLAVIQAAGGSLTFSTTPVSLNNGPMMATLSGLNFSTNYFFYVGAVNNNSLVTSTYAFLGAAATLAGAINPPVNTSTPTVAAGTLWASSATITFRNNGNPAATPAEIQLSIGSPPALNFNPFTNFISSIGVFNDGTAIGGVVTSSYTPTSLVGCTPYSARTRFYNAAGTPSAFDPSVVAFATLATTPAAPGGLVVLPNAGNTFTLTWNPSPTEGIARYNIYADTSAGTLPAVSSGALTAAGAANPQYFASLATATLAANLTTGGQYQFTTGPMPGGKPDLFKITATHRCGVEEAGGAQAWALSTGTVAAARAVIAFPAGGAQIAGCNTGLGTCASQSASNNLTIQGSVVSGAPTQIVFQYNDTDPGVLAAGNGLNTWITIATVTAGNQTAPPWTAVFDVTAANGAVAPFSGTGGGAAGTALPVQGQGGATGVVQLRAVAYASPASSDTAAAASQITLINGQAALANLTPGFVTESVASNGVVTKATVVPLTLATSLATTNSAPGGATLGMTIPVGAFAGSNGLPVVLSASPNPPAAVIAAIPPPAAVSGGAPTGTGLVTQICLGTINPMTGACNASGVMLAPGQTVALSIGYTPFANGDIATQAGGDSGVAPANARIFSTPNAATLFVDDTTPLAPDTTNHLIKASTPHFSFFGIFGVPAAASAVPADLSQARVYPLPWKPNGGNPDEGAPYVAGAAKSGIVFDQLPANTTITIYTITGRRVARVSSITSGAAQWDGRNDDGRPAATGGYFAVLSCNGSSVTKRLAIIR